MALIGSEEVGGLADPWPPTTGQKGPGVKEYDVEINGVKTTLLLSDSDAEARGLTKANQAQAPDTKQAQAPKNKARTTTSAKRAEAVSGAWGAKGKPHRVSEESDEDE